MRQLWRLTIAELLKLRKGSTLRAILLFPAIFILVDFVFFGSKAMDLETPTATSAHLQMLAPIKAVGAIWAGFFHPVLVALLPPSVFLPEHRSGLWKHLNAQPVSPRTLFLSKVGVIVLAAGATLLLMAIGLWLEWTVISFANRTNGLFAFPWRSLWRLLGWLMLGSLPLLALYAWTSMRISSGLVSVLFAITGLVLNIALSGQEQDPSWKRDLIPWILPYACAQRSIEDAQARQETHLAGTPFHKETDLSELAGTHVYYLPSGRKVTTTTTIPSYFLLPPPPTPRWLLATFSLSASAVLLGIGLVDARRGRA